LDATTMLDTTELDTAAVAASGALVNGPEDEPLDWDAIQWRHAEEDVRRLRQRIFAASRAGDLKRVRNLQKLLLRSRGNALVAVRRVTELNAGRKTAGVDGTVVVSPEQKAELVDWLQHRTRSWSPRPVKRVYVPKSNGRRRPLGIPVIADRCLQALTVNALEPEWEARFEPKSYGFRPGRGCHDAIVAIHTTASRTDAQRRWVLDADLAAAFDHLNHDHICESLGTFPAVGLVRQWLKAGVIEDGGFLATEEGAPQGGVISPLLMNVALHGMEAAAGVRYHTTGTRAGKTMPGCPVVIRYADDLLGICHSREQAEQVKARLSEWLAPRGLVFNETKTRITNFDTGVDFLGFTIRRFRGKLLTKQAEQRRVAADPQAAVHRGEGPAWGQRRHGDRQAQPDHHRVGGLLSDRGVQTCLRRAGRTRVEAGLQMGLVLPCEQVQALGDRSVLRQVQPGQAGQVDIREPGHRLLPAQVRLDPDRPAPDGGRNGVPGRPVPARILGPAATPQPAPGDERDHATAPASPARSMPALPRPAATRRP
jgi:RNA-directed DNA polymerase